MILAFEAFLPNITWAPADSSLLILAVMAALAIMIIIAYVFGMIPWLLLRVFGLFRRVVRAGFHLWRHSISWAPWPIFLLAEIGFVIVGWWQVEEFPALAIGHTDHSDHS